MEKTDEHMRQLKLSGMGITENVIKEMLVEEDSALVIDMADNIIVFSTKRADELFGYIQGELQGKNFYELMPERYRERHEGHVDKFRKDSSRRSMGQNTGLELFGLKKNGIEFGIEIELTPRAKFGIMFTIARVTPKRVMG